MRRDSIRTTGRAWPTPAGRPACTVSMEYPESTRLRPRARCDLRLAPLARASSRSGSVPTGIFLLDPEPIEHPIGPDGRGEKPGRAAIIRPCGKDQTIEGGVRLPQPRHPPPDLHSEIRGERHALAAVPHAVINVVSAAQMRQRIEGVRDPARPRVIELDLAQLGKYLCEHRPQARHAGERIALAQDRKSVV